MKLKALSFVLANFFFYIILYLIQSSVLRINLTKIPLIIFSLILFTLHSILLNNHSIKPILL